MLLHWIHASSPSIRIDGEKMHLQVFWQGVEPKALHCAEMRPMEKDLSHLPHSCLRGQLLSSCTTSRWLQPLRGRVHLVLMRRRKRKNGDGAQDHQQLIQSLLYEWKHFPLMQKIPLGSMRTKLWVIHTSTSHLAGSTCGSAHSNCCHVSLHILTWCYSVNYSWKGIARTPFFHGTSIGSSTDTMCLVTDPICGIKITGANLNTEQVWYICNRGLESGYSQFKCLIRVVHNSTITQSFWAATIPLQVHWKTRAQTHERSKFQKISSRISP